jgi:acetylornithine deacetylase/succinyl-diaminopimelate desuccinylase-like protein
MDRRAFLLASAAPLFAPSVGPRSQGPAGLPVPPARTPVAVDDAEVLELTRALSRIPSFTTEEQEVAAFLDGLFRREGLESALMEVDPGRVQVIARLKGSGGGRTLMLNGHMDTDPLPSGMTRDPWTPTIEGDRFYGAGIGNMKGGLASMIVGTLAAKRAGFTRRGDVVLACVVGELQGGVGTVRMLKAGVRADAAIVAEPHGAGNVFTKHAGVMEFAVHVLGRTAHISRKEEGDNAILRAGEAASTLEAMALAGPRDPELPGLPRLNVGSIIGGRGRDVELRGPNWVPDFATLYVDVRFTQGMTPASILAEVRRALDARPGLRYEIEFPLDPRRRILREVMMPFAIAADAPFVREVAGSVEEVAGRPPHVGVVLPNGYSGNDTSHLAAAGIPCLLYGPSGDMDGADRWTSVSQMLTCTRVYADVIRRVCS